MPLTSSDLEKHKLPGLPEAFYYVPNFITAAEEDHLLQSLPPRKWIELSRRRLQAHPSRLTAKDVLLNEPLPDYLVRPIVDRLAGLELFGTEPTKTVTTSPCTPPSKMPNHVLVNEYTPGQGILAHRDGQAYAPCVATVSLGDSIVLDIYRHSPSSKVPGAPFARILQEPGSLLVTTAEAYTTTLYGIAETCVDEGLCSDTVANWASLDEGTAGPDFEERRQE